jgi:hypothetical protein
MKQRQANVETTSGPDAADVDHKTSWYTRRFGWIPRPVRQIIILVIGCTLLLLAALGMMLPIVPGVVFLPLALAVLAIEFAWAAQWLRQIKKGTTGLRDRWRNGWKNQGNQRSQVSGQNADVRGQGAVRPRKSAI